MQTNPFQVLTHQRTPCVPRDEKPETRSDAMTNMDSLKSNVGGFGGAVLCAPEDNLKQANWSLCLKSHALQTFMDLIDSH